MMLFAGDLGVLIDFGNSRPGLVLQRRESRLSDVWRDFKIDGETVKAPFDIESLPRGEYRLIHALGRKESK